MNKSDFFFELPQELIAQTPAERRENSRLMCLDKLTGAITHRFFYELPELLRAGDCLVLNDTRVLPARLYGYEGSGLRGQGSGDGGCEGAGSREKGSGDAKERAVIEVLLLRDLGGDVWECMTRPGKKTKTGTRLVFGDGELKASVIGIADGGNRHIKFEYEGIFLETLDRLGEMPLPPYIHEKLEDKERYQTVYSRALGSAAAPTAGLHFTKELLEDIAGRGVRICYVTLHVGLGTFRPVRADRIGEHKMHAEYYIMPDETAQAINETKAGGGRVIAVGTTSCRTIESCADDTGLIKFASGLTDIFIYPGYEFKCMDALLTNFHLPESTLIMLVSALAGRENVLNAYNEAIREQYRFFSFGDCCFVH